MRGRGRAWVVGGWVSGFVNVFVDRNFSFVSPISFLTKCSDNLINQRTLLTLSSTRRLQWQWQMKKVKWKLSKKERNNWILS